MKRAGILFISAAALSAVQAATIDLNLTGSPEGPAASVSGFDKTIRGLAYAGVPATNPVTVANGDTVHLTLTLDAPVWLVYPYALSAGSIPHDQLTLSFSGAMARTTTTAGTTSLYLSNRLVTSQPILENFYGSGVIVDSIQLGGAALAFDTVTSTFVVSGLASAATLQSAYLEYTAVPLSQISEPPVVFGGGVQLQPAVPEPASFFMMMTGLALLLGRRARPPRQ